MTKLTFYTAATLDGFTADPDDSLDWLFVQDQDAAGPLNYDEFIKDIGAIVMGSTTYEWVRQRTDLMIEETGSAWPHEMATWVMTSRDLSAIEGADIRFASGDVKPVHNAMVEAAGGQDLWVVGGGDLAGQFADAGLLDEVITYTAAVTLGAGRPLLPRRLALKRLESHGNGAFVASRYEVVGPGSGAPAEPSQR